MSAITKIREQAKQEVRRVKRLNFNAAVFITIVSPIITGTMLTFYKEILGIGDVVFWIPFGLFLVLHLWASYSFISDTPLVQEAFLEASHIADENAALRDETQKLAMDIRYFALLQECAFHWVSMQRIYGSRGTLNLDDGIEAIGEILAPVLKARDMLFGFQAGELWNFAVYRFDRLGNELAPVWREHHESHPATNLGRHWAPGEGHVGTCFARGEAIITANATDPSVAALVRAPAGKRIETDDSIYKSFAAIPVGPVDAGERPVGVLVATSDKIGRFDTANCLILRHAAAVIANIEGLPNVLSP